MKKKLCSKFLAFSALACFGVVGAMAAISETKQEVANVKADGVLPTYEFSGLFAPGWNPIVSGNTVSYIAELATGFAKNSNTNFANTVGSGDKVKINGEAIYGKDNIVFSHSQDDVHVLFTLPLNLVVAAPGSQYCILEIEEGTLFDGVQLAKTTMLINPENYIAFIGESYAVEVTGFRPDVWGWYSIDLTSDCYAGIPQTSITYVNSANGLNFADKIYVNGDPSKLLIKKQASYAVTFNINGGIGISFHSGDLNYLAGDIHSLTILEGCEFPIIDTQNAFTFNRYVVEKTTEIDALFGQFRVVTDKKVKEINSYLINAQWLPLSFEGVSNYAFGHTQNAAFNALDYVSKIQIRKKGETVYTSGSEMLAQDIVMGGFNGDSTIFGIPFTVASGIYGALIDEIYIPAGTYFPAPNFLTYGGLIKTTNDIHAYRYIDNFFTRKEVEDSVSVAYGVNGWMQFSFGSNHFATAPAGYADGFGKFELFNLFTNISLELNDGKSYPLADFVNLNPAAGYRRLFENNGKFTLEYVANHGATSFADVVSVSIPKGTEFPSYDHHVDFVSIIIDKDYKFVNAGGGFFIDNDPSKLIETEVSAIGGVNSFVESSITKTNFVFNVTNTDYKTTQNVLGSAQLADSFFSHIEFYDQKGTRLPVSKANFVVMFMNWGGYDYLIQFMNDVVDNAYEVVFKKGMVIPTENGSINLTLANDCRFIFAAANLYANTKVLDAFVTNYMHPEISKDNTGTGGCVTWYGSSRDAFNELTLAEKVVYTSSDEYSDYWSRLTSWARANGESFDIATASLHESPNVGVKLFVENNESIILLIAIVSLVSLGIIAVFVKYKKHA